MLAACVFAMSARIPLAAVAAVALLMAATGPVPVAARQTLAHATASYDIDATLDPAARRLTGREVITWRNPGTVPAYSVRLHLYWNAWSTTASSWVRQRALAGDEGDWADRAPGDFGWQHITELRLLDASGTPVADLLPTLRFVQPTDQNADDRTLVAADLPDGIAPGEIVRLHVAWTAQVPRPVARTGAIGDYFFLAHWFPKMGVFEGDGWNARQFFANTEFFADFGRYDVRLTVPSGWVVGATGREVSRADQGATATHRYVQEDVHDFAWTTSPHFLEFTQPFEHPSLPPVTMRLLLQPEHRGQEARHFAATAAALAHYGEWYGAYPYPHITIVDPAWQSRSGGMEYPTLFTAGTRWLAPAGSNTPEAVIVHEAGHQFWYGIVANNEVTDAWMDEGLNTFSAARVEDVAFSPNYRVERFFGGFIPWQYRDIPLSRDTDGNGLNGYRRAARRDALGYASYLYWPGTHGDITYSKTALWLHTLERQFGWSRLRPALATYFQRFRYRHPRPEQFFQTISEELGEDLTPFFEEVYAGSNVVDYAAERLHAEPARVRRVADPSRSEPLFEDAAPPDRYRSTVVVRRLGEARFPVDVLVAFEDGEQVREQWDGQARWQSFIYEKTSPAVSVSVDPDRVLLLDVNYTNNSLTTRPEGGTAAWHWSLRWMVWLQDLLMTCAFFA